MTALGGKDEKEYFFSKGFAQFLHSTDSPKHDVISWVVVTEGVLPHLIRHEHDQIMGPCIGGKIVTLTTQTDRASSHQTLRPGLHNKSRGTYTDNDGIICG